MYVRSRFLARRGVLELAMSIEVCMLSWLKGGGVLEHPKHPPVSAPGGPFYRVSQCPPAISDKVWKSVCGELSRLLH